MQVTVEEVPWSCGKRELTIPHMQHLAEWSKSLSWKEVAKKFKTNRDKVFRSVEWIVNWGLKHRDLSGITAIAVDEIQWKKGHKYLTLGYQINKDFVRLLWIGRDRTEERFKKFFETLGEEKSKKIEYVCSDIWKPYLKVIQEMISQAVHILDRFHIDANMNKAVDAVRASEKKMQADGIEPVLKNSKWTLLRRRENLTEKQNLKLSEILKYNLKAVRAYLLKEDFQQLWTYSCPMWAGKFIDQWIAKAMRSKLDPMKKEAKTIRKHKELILNWFRA